MIRIEKIIDGNELSPGDLIFVKSRFINFGLFFLISKIHWDLALQPLNSNPSFFLSFSPFEHPIPEIWKVIQTKVIEENPSQACIFNV
jgi:hypothetical protein